MKTEHFSFVAALIRQQIDEVNKAAAEDSELVSAGDEMGHTVPESTQVVEAGNNLADRGTRSMFEAGAITLQSQQVPVMFDDLEGVGLTFRNFCAKLAAWLTAMLPSYNFCFPSRCDRVEFQGGDKVSFVLHIKLLSGSQLSKIREYRSMKVCYKSMVDNCQYLDYLYCSPKFHGQKHQDCVILKTISGFIFARLLFIFTCQVAEDTFPICLTCPLDASTGQSRVKDRDLRINRIRTKTSTEFFFVQSIVRGAPIIQDFGKAGDYFVMDVTDHTGDMFLCCEEIFGR